MLHALSALFRVTFCRRCIELFLRHRRTGHHLGHHGTHIGCSSCLLRQGTFRQHPVATLLQAHKLVLQAIVVAQEHVDVLSRQVLGTNGLDLGLHTVGHLAQTHRTCQARTALQGVQVAQYFAARRQVVRICRPFTQRHTQLGQQILRFFLKNQEEIGVQQINHIDGI